MLIRLIRIGAWLALAAILFVTVSPIGYRPHDVVSTDFDRAAAYAVLSALFVFAYPRHRLAIAVLVVLVAGGAELFQFISPTRHPHLADAMVKAAGGIGGLFAGSLLHSGMAQLLSGARRAPAVPAEERRSVS